MERLIVGDNILTAIMCAFIQNKKKMCIHTFNKKTIFYKLNLYNVVHVILTNIPIKRIEIIAQLIIAINNVKECKNDESIKVEEEEEEYPCLSATFQ